MKAAQEAATHRELGRSEAIAEVVAWLRLDNGKGSEAGVDFGNIFADVIERGEYRAKAPR